MTIDEAIAFCNEKASNIKLKAEPEVFIQIAERLEELKRFKKDMFSANEQIKDLMSAEADKTLQAYKCGYNKAVDDFAELIHKKLCIYDTIDDLAEQLKAGAR